MAAITLPQVKDAFALAAQVYDGVIAPQIAAKRLSEDTGLNINSGRDFLAQFRCMMRGEVFKRTQSALALQYFLPRILLERGHTAAAKAVIAVWKHIEYYEGIEKTRLLQLRTIVSGFETSLTGPIPTEIYEQKLSADVQLSRRDTSAERQMRLANANKKPSVATVTTNIFIRNKDVIAEVLEQAAGICGKCKKPAPFNRRSDQRPFLEVHHKLQLAHDGEDTVENAIALCPNCHRQLHHG